MRDFLQRVVADKRRELAARAARSPGVLAPGPAPRGFLAALRGEGRFVAEIKRRSPSVPRFPRRESVERLARIYEAAGAAALSVLTDEARFGTTLDDLRRAREATRLPVLAKDFLLVPRQVEEARAAGADGVLLIARILSLEELRDLLRRTRELGMEALVECHDEEDLRLAERAGAAIVGVNNRDLATLEVDAGRAEGLAGRIPAGAVGVCESGIASRGDVERLAAAGYGAFLVGGALLEADDPGRKLAELRGAAGG